jgi:hypothetical protein
MTAAQDHIELGNFSKKTRNVKKTFSFFGWRWEQRLCARLDAVGDFSPEPPRSTTIKIETKWFSRFLGTGPSGEEIETFILPERYFLVIGFFDRDSSRPKEKLILFNNTRGSVDDLFRSLHREISDLRGFKRFLSLKSVCSFRIYEV